MLRVSSVTTSAPPARSTCTTSGSTRAPRPAACRWMDDQQQRGHGSSLPGFRIPAGSSRVLDRPKDVDPQLADLRGQPGRMIGADGMVVGDRRAGADDRVGGGSLRRVPLAEGIASRRRGQHREVQRGARRVQVGHVTAHEHAANLGAPEAPRSGPPAPPSAPRGSSVQEAAVSSVSTSTPASSRSSRRYGAAKRPASQALPARGAGTDAARGTHDLETELAASAAPDAARLPSRRSPSP